jgi:hypothetical protein
MIGTFGSEKLRSHVVPSGLVKVAGRIVAGRREHGQSSSFARPIWREISSKNSMPVFSGANLIGGLLFGSIGFVAFVYGKRMHVWKPMLLGLALMAYPYFVANDIALFVIGAAGTAALFLFRD